MEHLKVLKFEKAFVKFQVKVATVIRQIDAGKEIPKIIERGIPLLIHFQVSEAMNEILGD